MDSPEHDVIVVGAGNAALCAALSACEHGARVVVLECAPEAEANGNSRFAGGVMRFAFDGVDDLRKVADLTDEEIAGADFGTYTRAQYFDDLFRLTQYRTDPTLVELLVTRSLDTMIWLRGQGARFVSIYGRQAGKVGGRWKFFGGLPIEASGGGAGLVQSLMAAAHRRGVEILYETRALSLLWDGVRVSGVRVRSGGKLRDLTARAVVLACGGFEANAEWRTRYLGPGWELAKVRGTRFNTGDGLRMALEIGASAIGNWSGSTPAAGTGTRPNSAISPSATSSRSTAIPSASWSTPMAGASSTRAPTSTASPTPSTAAPSWSNLASLPGRSSMRRCSTCCVPSTGSSA